MTELLASSQTLESNEVTNDNGYNNDYVQTTENNIEDENNNNKEQDNSATLAEDNGKSE